MKKICFFLPIILTLATGGTVFAQVANKDSVAWKLLSGEKQLQNWADEMENARPETLDEAWDALEVLLRAERDDAAIRFLPRLKTLGLKEGPTWHNGSRQARVTEALCNVPAERARLGIAFFETCGAVFAPVFGFKNLAQSMKNTGWSDEQILDWLDARCQSALAAELKEEEWWFVNDIAYLQILWPGAGTSWRRWWRPYVDCLRESPRRDEILQRAMEDARESPDDMKKWVVFLAMHAEYHHGLETQNADWLLATVEQQSPLQALIIAQFVERFARKNEMKEAFLKRALSEPLGDGECGTFREIMKGRSNVPLFGEPPSNELVRIMFRVEVMDGLNKLYLRLNRGDDAQRVMLEARELRKEHKLRDGSFLLAGMTQSISGFRVVEDEIKEREALDETKPDYWRERAAYYRGRNEPKELEEALRRLLACYDTADFKKDASNHHPHLSAFRDLFQFLWFTKRQDEAMELFKAYRSAAKGNTGILYSLYLYGARSVKEANRFDEIEPGLVEDLRDVYEELKTKPNPRPNAGISLILNFWDEALRAGILDFKNDPAAWAMLARTGNYHTGSLMSCVGSLLFPKADRDFIKSLNSNVRPYPVTPQKQELDDEMFRVLKEVVERGVFPGWQVRAFGEIFQPAADLENSNWFLLAALQIAQDDYEKQRCRTGLIANYIAMGDLENCEKHIPLYEGLDNVDVRMLFRFLQQTADLAEKTGAPEAAARMRARIQNLGAFGND